VRGILNDLVESGFVLRSGRGEETRYRVATADELADIGNSLDDRAEDALSALAWLHVYREGPVTLERLHQLIPTARTQLEKALLSLTSDSRIVATVRADGDQEYSTQNVLIPLGEAAGWEAAVVDHHRTVLNAIAAKMTSGQRTSARADEVGGTTLTFDLWSGHPREQEVRRLLADTRSRVLALWDEVTEYNKTQSPPEQYQVHYYCGQFLVSEENP
jgi:hypothetical protein